MYIRELSSLDYRNYAESVIFKPSIYGKIDFRSCHEDLSLVGRGRSACVFRVKNTDKVIKVFPPKFQYIARREGEIYESLGQMPQFPSIYETGENYIVIDYIMGWTLFECLNKGIKINERQVEEIDHALQLSREMGLNPSDIHLRNILITPDQEIKVIDVARFKQTVPCRQWHDLKVAYFRYYHSRYFPKKIPSGIIEAIGILYKRNAIPKMLLRDKKNVSHAE